MYIYLCIGSYDRMFKMYTEHLDTCTYMWMHTNIYEYMYIYLDIEIYYGMFKTYTIYNLTFKYKCINMFMSMKWRFQT
jgi:hypothetical protein